MPARCGRSQCESAHNRHDGVGRNLLQNIPSSILAMRRETVGRIVLATLMGGAGASNAIFEGVLISDRDIRAEIDSERIVLDPYDSAMVQPSSVDVRIDRFFRLFDNHKYAHIDPAEEQPELTRLVEVESGEPFILHPGEFVLGSTYETVTLPDDIAARLEGKSSLGRLGLLTHSTAGFIDPGFSGHVTLEL